MHMPENKLPPPGDAPFGTLPRRSSWPLVSLIVLFGLWFCFLVWMALRYPAR
jgi:hypothetical protein